jgi:predicted choloylglycine hydrolase
MGVPYDEVYEELKGLLLDDGALNSKITTGYLITKGYVHYNFDDDLYSAIQVINNKDGVLFDVKDGEHVVYVKDDTIYEDIKRSELLWYLEKHKISGFYVKIDKGVGLL